MSSDSFSERRARLDYYYDAIYSTILAKQHPISGLLPASVAVLRHGDYTHCWTRDAVYSILAVYGLAQAYRRIDDDTCRAYELEHSVIKLMRGLLTSMMRQADKIEKFKYTQSPTDSLHAKYDTANGTTVVADDAWGHLQIDATSIFILMLAEMTASSYNIVHTMDEVDFVQNLVFYIERAYRTPDYGIWERGDKSNHGEVELNSSSVGMAVAALEAINGLNLFGPRGGPSSVIHASPDEVTRNYVTLLTQLPRESSSKEVDSAVLSVIGYPAFAVRDKAVRDKTRAEILGKLRGRYGCRRFLRDGHQCVNEDSTRLFYNHRELKEFENLECEWPLFFTYLILDGLFTGNHKQAKEYFDAISPLLIDSVSMNFINADSDSEKAAPTAGHTPLIPELFYVPADRLDAERANPHSQERKPNDNLPLVWANSLYFLGCLIRDNLLEPAEIDPLGRRFNALRDSERDNLVQIVLLSESVDLQQRLRAHGVETETFEQVRPIRVLHPSALSDVYSILGQNAKLNLSGRPNRPMGTLSTCRLYRVQGQLYAFTPNFMDTHQYYLSSDCEYLVSSITDELQFTRRHWMDNGRPTMTLMLTENMFDSHNLATSTAGSDSGKAESMLLDTFGTRHRSLLKFIMALRSGSYAGMRVRLGRLTEMIPTGHIVCLDFLVNKDKALWAKTLHLEEFRHESLSRSNSRLRLDEKDSLYDGHDGQSELNSRGLSRRSTICGISKDLTMPIGEAVAAAFASLAKPAKGGSWKLLDHVDTPTPASSAEAPQNDAAPSASTIESNLRNLGLDDKGLVANVGDDGRESEDEEEEDALMIKPIAHQSNSNLASTPEPIELSLGDPSMFDIAVENLTASANIFDQIDILHYMHSCRGPDFYVERLGVTVAELIEEVYVKSMRLNLWSVVRQAAGLTKKMVPELALSITELIVRRLHVSIGFGHLETTITRPINPEELQHSMANAFRGSDPREGPLVQEIIRACADLARSDVGLFNGIMCLRTHDIIIAIREELMRLRGCDEVAAVEILMQSSPYQLKLLLLTVLSGPLLNSTSTHTLVSEEMVAPVLNQLKDESSLVEPLESAAIDRNVMLATPCRVPLKRVRTRDIPDLSSKPSWIIQVQSAGFIDGNFATILLDGQPLTNSSRGLHVAVIDLHERTVAEIGVFDTHFSAQDSNDLAFMLNSMRPGMLVCIAAQDEFVEHLTPMAIKALESLCAHKVHGAQYRDSWCMIGIKRLNTELDGRVCECLEELSKSGSGPTTRIQYMLNFDDGSDDVFSPKLREQSNTIPSGLFTPPSHGRWLRRRKNDGALNRMPSGFYPLVWSLLQRSNCGIRLGQAFLASDPLIFDRTPEEPNFAQIVERFMDANIPDPAEKQAVAVVIVTLYWIFADNKRGDQSGVGRGEIDPLRYIEVAIKEFWSTWVRQHSGTASKTGDSGTAVDLSLENHLMLARNLFFDLQPRDMVAYIACTILAEAQLELPEGEQDGWVKIIVESVCDSECILV